MDTFYFFACWQILQRTRQSQEPVSVATRHRLSKEAASQDFSWKGVWPGWLSDWGNKLLDAVHLLQRPRSGHGDSMHQYRDSLGQQRDKLARPQLTPSAKIIAAMAMRGSFFKFTMDQAEQVTKHLAATPITDTILRELEQESAASLLRQAEIEEADTQPFSEFLEGYLALP